MGYVNSLVEDMIFVLIGTILVIVITTNLDALTFFRDFSDASLNLIRVGLVGGFIALVLLYMSGRYRG